MTVHASHDEDGADPALALFLALLEADMAARPADAVHSLPAALISRMEALTDGAGEIDPDVSIEGEVSL